MPIITDLNIQKALDAITQSPEKVPAVFQELKENQNGLLAFLAHHASQNESESTKNFIFYLGMIVWKAYQNEYGQLPQVATKQFISIENQYWEILEELLHKKNETNQKAFELFKELNQPYLLKFVSNEIENIAKIEKVKDKGVFFIIFHTIMKAFNTENHTEEIK